MIEHLQARLRQANQRAANAETNSSHAQIEEHTAMVRKAFERVQELEDAISQLQACSLALSPVMQFHASAHSGDYDRGIKQDMLDFQDTQREAL